MFDSAMISGAVFGGLAAAIIILGMTMLRKAITCPSCGEEQPKFRKPANSKQAMWGGFTCAKCGTEMDGRGKLRETK
jgi:transposase-like protein